MRVASNIVAELRKALLSLLLAAVLDRTRRRQAAERCACSSEGGVGRGGQSEVEQPSCRTSLTAQLYGEPDGCPTCIRQK